MMRTTLYISETLYQRLHLAAKQQAKSVSQLAQVLLDTALAIEEKKRLDTMYTALNAIKGASKDPSTDTSTTVDEVLYGDSGAWRGEPSDTGLWELPKSHDK